MPQIDIKRQIRYKAPKSAEVLWKEFRGGLNTLLNPIEIAENELTQSDNIYLIGRGIPTKRGGLNNYFLTAASIASTNQMVRGLKMAKFASGASGVLELLAVSDAGYLVRRNGASYTILPGYSYSSGYDIQMAQILNRVFVANGQNALTKYSGISIFPFTTISRPTNITATNVSGVSGTFTYSYMISAENDVGETLASDRVSVLNLPRALESTTVRISIPAASPASSVVRYNIYARDQGFETFLTSLPAAGTATISYFDNGLLIPSLIALPPEADTTGGPIFKYLISHKDKIVGGNVNISPSRIVWSGGGQHVDRFHWSVGGGYVEISPDDGDEITGLLDAFDSIIVFKRRSIWKIILEVSSQGIVVPKIILLSRALGCAAPKTIKQVENDVFFLSDKGVFTLGNEAYFPDVLRTNELSAKIRLTFQEMNKAQIGSCAAIYHDNKYRIAFPNTGSTKNNQEVWFDRERLAWIGPMSYPANPHIYEIFFDGDNSEHLVWGDAGDNFVSEFSTNFNTDKGTTISSTLITRKEIFTDPFLFKRIREFVSSWRNVNGTVKVNIVIQNRDGDIAVAKSFTITPPTGGGTGVGWGADPWGTEPWGNSSGAGGGSAANDIVRWLNLLTTARSIQWEIITTGTNDNYQLLALKMKAHLLGKGIIPNDEKIFS